MSEISVKANVILKLGREEVVIMEEEAKELQKQLNALFPPTNPYWWYPTVPIPGDVLDRWKYQTGPHCHE